MIINFFIGTTAELLKIYPVAKLLDDSKYRIIASGQQNVEVANLQKYLPIEVDFNFMSMKDNKAGIENTFDAVVWSTKYFFKILSYFLIGSRKFEKKQVVVVHGDTLTCLVTSIAAFVAKKRLFHIEAGLRSESLFHPFPEEFTRRIVSKIAEVNFAPSSKECSNLIDSKGIVINTFGNTGRDTLFSVESRMPKDLRIPIRFCIVSLHRNELFQNHLVLARTLNEISKLTHDIPVIFVCDKRFKTRIEELLNELDFKKSNLILSTKLVFPEFKFLLERCDFLVTDSGGQQEEAAAMNIPCLVHRLVTERFDGIGRNVQISKWEPGSILAFALKSHEAGNVDVKSRVSPSFIVAEALDSVFYNEVP
jgi:UDP-N-acetylglucosamine 2-epimerase (non-hydrolysing)